MSIQKWKTELVRFNVEFGPPSLFERVRFKMRDVHSLNMNGPHYNTRLSERFIPVAVVDHIENFDINDWRLVTAEVRRDRGKFYNSTWEYVYDGQAYWVTVGLGGIVVTIVKKDSSGIEKCVRSGEFYNYVEEVNKKLMEEDFMSSVDSIKSSQQSREF